MNKKLSTNLVSLIGAGSLFIAGCDSQPVTWTEQDLVQTRASIDLPSTTSLGLTCNVIMRDFDNDGHVDALTFNHRVVYFGKGKGQLVEDRGYHLSPESKIISAEIQLKLDAFYASQKDMQRELLKENNVFKSTY